MPLCHCVGRPMVPSLPWWFRPFRDSLANSTNGHNRSIENSTTNGYYGIAPISSLSLFKAYISSDDSCHLSSLRHLFQIWSLVSTDSAQRKVRSKLSENRNNSIVLNSSYKICAVAGRCEGYTASSAKNLPFQTIVLVFLATTAHFWDPN